MKIRIKWLVLIWFVMLAIGARAQSTCLFSLEPEQVPLKKVLAQIESTCKLEFSYDPELVSDYLVSCRLTDASLSDALHEILKGLPFSWEESGPGYILLIPKDLPLVHLSGQVRDAETGEVLPFARVMLMPGITGTMSDENGRFSLSTRARFPLTLKAHYIGYTAIETEVVAAGSKNYLLKMEPLELKMSDVVVEGKMNMLEQKGSFSGLTLNPKLLASFPHVGEVDAMRTIKLLPGVKGTSETNSGIAIRGSRPDQTLVLYDGFTLYHLGHFFGTFSSINAHSIKSIEVNRSGYSSKYSGRTSGLVRITGREGRKEGINAGIGMNLLSYNGLLEVPIGKKVTTMFTFRQDYSRLFYTPLYNQLNNSIGFNRLVEGVASTGISNNISFSPDIKFYDFSGKATWNISEDQSVTVSTYNSNDVINSNLKQKDTLSEYSFESSYQSSWFNLGISAAWEKQWNERFHSRVSFAYSHFTSRTYLDTLTEVVAGDTINRKIDQNNTNYIYDRNLRIDNRYRFNPHHEIHFGADGKIAEMYISLETDDDYKDLFYGNNNQIGVYFEDRIQIREKLSIKGGLRALFNTIVYRPLLEPRLSIAWIPTANWLFKADYGYYNQFARSLVPRNNIGLIPGFWLYPDDTTLLPSRSQQISLGSHFKHKGVYTELEVYGRKVQNTYEVHPGINSLYEDDGLISQNSTGKMKLIGLDLLLGLENKRFNCWAALSVQKAAIKSDSLNGGAWYSPSYVNNLELKLSSLYKIKKWHFSGTWIYGNGRPFTEVKNLAPINTLPISNGSLIPYHRLDLSVKYHFKIRESRAHVGFSVFNAYHRYNISAIHYVESFYDEHTGQVLVDPVPVPVEIPNLGITPNVFFEWSLR